MFSDDLSKQAGQLIELCRDKKQTIVTAESCTGGLVSGLLTEIEGSSDVFERGFVTYSNEAKVQLLRVDPMNLMHFGAVSAEIAKEMVDGALARARATVGVSVTGIAGPGGGTQSKPVGLVYIAVARYKDAPKVEKFTFGDLGRTAIRLKTVEASLAMLTELVSA